MYIGAFSRAWSHWRLYSGVSDGAPDGPILMPPLMSYPRSLAMNRRAWYLKVDRASLSHPIGERVV
jgi:hypothetical protein